MGRTELKLAEIENEIKFLKQKVAKLESEKVEKLKEEIVESKSKIKSKNKKDKE